MCTHVFIYTHAVISRCASKCVHSKRNTCVFHFFGCVYDLFGNLNNGNKESLSSNAIAIRRLTNPYTKILWKKEDFVQTA